jgi:mRNA-degrading endonuclease RelE of RelBE toxin-antitoxin system
LIVLEILATPTFLKAVKKLHAKDKSVVDKAVKAIATNPAIGEEKKGDLAGIFVYKFKINKQEVLLSYQLRPNKVSPVSVMLYSIGSHENFYSDLKRMN